MAKGVDSLGLEYAKKNNIPIKEFHPVWHPNGHYDSQAGFKRNFLMAQYAEALIAITNGSSGTSNMIEHMERLNKPVFIVRV